VPNKYEMLGGDGSKLHVGDEVIECDSGKLAGTIQKLRLPPENRNMPDVDVLARGDDRPRGKLALELCKTTDSPAVSLVTPSKFTPFG